VHQAFGALAADRFQADADLDGLVAMRRADRLELRLPRPHRRVAAKANFSKFLGKLPGKKIEHLLRFGRPGRVFDTRIDVFRVLAEDHHVDFFGMSNRRGHAAVPADRPQTDEQVEQLPQRDVQRADSAANRRRQRSLDPDVVGAKRLDGLVRQPVVELLEALFAGVHLFPRDLPLPAVCAVDRGVHHPHARAPDVRSGPISFDERNNRIVRDDEPAALQRNRVHM
jgi:hypothetical protein